MKKQGAKEKLRRLVAPLLGVAGQGSSLAFKAFSSIRPRISLRFEGIGVTLRDGTVILDSVNGHFSHSKVRPAHKTWQNSSYVSERMHDISPQIYTRTNVFTRIIGKIGIKDVESYGDQGA